jgi:RNA polymerase sigma-70 factor (ECF subfamily)
MDSPDSTSTIGKKLTNGAKLATAWDQFYDYCFTIINQCPGVRRLSSADREDCTQEVMMEIVRKFGEHRPESIQDHLAGWIRVISRNKAADIVRRRFRRPEVLFDDGAGAAVPCGGPADGDPELSRGERLSLVWEALVSLDHKVPVTSYLVFYLRTIEGWSVQETAELFQISPEEARVRCHRVKKKFGSILESKGRKRGGPGPSPSA